MSVSEGGSHADLTKLTKAMSINLLPSSIFYSAKQASEATLYVYTRLLI